MKKTLLVGICVFLLGVATSLFRHKIVAGDTAARVIAEDKVQVIIANDTKYPIRVYLNQDMASTTLVNPDRTFVQQIRSGDMVNVYTPEHNTTFHVELNDAGRKELLGKEVTTSVQELRDVTQKRTLSGFGIETEHGTKEYLNIEEEAVPPYSGDVISY